MKNLIVVLIILFASILASLPIAKPGLYTIHDDQQVARLFVFDQALKAGQFPVRWVDGLGFGFGYPLFVFYPPFVYMLGEIFHLLGFGFIDSVKIVFFLGIFGSGLAMYIFARELFGKLPGAVSALFYMFVPYRALDIYIRGALAESFSFVWLPLILWSFWKLTSTGKKKYLLLSSAFLALLMITHNLIFLPFMLILPFYLLFLILNSQDKRLITYHLSLCLQQVSPLFSGYLQFLRGDSQLSMIYSWLILLVIRFTLFIRSNFGTGRGVLGDPQPALPMAFPLKSANCTFCHQLVFSF